MAAAGSITAMNVSVVWWAIRFLVLNSRTMMREIAIAARNLVIGGNMKTLKLKPREAVAYVNECLFIDRAMHPHGDIPQRNIWDVFGVKEDIFVTLRPDFAAYHFNAMPSYSIDLVGLCMLARSSTAKIIFEIGTLNGATAMHLSLNAPGAEVFTLDLPPNYSSQLDTNASDTEQQSRRTFASLGDRIHRLYGDSAAFDFSPFWNRVDLFFIDGAHTYEYVKNDTLRALECIRKDGVIAWHDYGRCGVNGVSKWLHEFRSQGYEVQRIPGGSLAYAIV
jgi:predicted O-methyltransferase YrrM